MNWSQPMPVSRLAMRAMSAGIRPSAPCRASTTMKSLPSPFILRYAIWRCVTRCRSSRLRPVPAFAQLYGGSRGKKRDARRGVVNGSASAGLTVPAFVVYEPRRIRDSSVLSPPPGTRGRGGQRPPAMFARGRVLRLGFASRSGSGAVPPGPDLCHRDLGTPSSGRVFAARIVGGANGWWRGCRLRRRTGSGSGAG